MEAGAPQADADAEAAEARAEQKRERARLKKIVGALGWKLIGSTTVEILVRREVLVGKRTVIVRGRVSMPLPDELTAEAGERAVAPVVDPSVAKFVATLGRAAAKTLSLPDDSAQRHAYDKPSFFSALEDAQRGLVRAYQDLENRRVDERVEADLGLRFYLEGLGRDRRSFEYFVGPTNSGKTHAAIEALREAETGVYLAPLRLLALEVYERLKELGLPASLVTGEERVTDSTARHVSSTVEMVDLGREIDVAVVDEAQMLGDEQRGWAWTLAIAGVRAKRVIMCGSEDGLQAARRLVARLGAPLRERRFERKNPLEVVDAVPLGALRGGDAVVAFSRNAVVGLQAQIGRGGLTTAAIYGSLSPAVRRREAERFRNGSAQVLVATDAIGLGLNLPIRRLIFASVEKFDGVAERALTPPEIRQIAGRAGRYGIHEKGQVTALDPRAVRLLRASIDRFDPEPGDLPIWISPTDEHLRRLSAIIGTTRVGRLLQFFATRILRDEESDLRIANLSETIEVANALEMNDRFLQLPLEVRCTYSRAPVTTRGNGLVVLSRWGEQHASEGVVAGVELTSGSPGVDRLLLHEDRARLATLYLWLSQRFPSVYASGAEVARVRERIDDDIHDALMRAGDHPKRERTAPQPFRRKGPPKFNPRRLRK